MGENRLRVGILGTGLMAVEMAEAIRTMEHIEVCAAASRSREGADAFAGKFPHCRVYETYEALLCDPEVDLVYVASPHSHHALHAGMCIDAGKPVLVEKSFTANAAQARALLEKARQAGVFLAEAIWPRYMPMAETIRETVWSGAIGKVNAISANLGYPVTDKPRILDPERAGGALLDVGIYPLTFVSLIAGDEITGICAQAKKADTGVDLEDQIAMTIQSGGREICCNLYASVNGPSDRTGIVYGTDGYLIVGNVNNFEWMEIYDRDHRLVKRVPRPEQTQTGYVYQFEACRHALAAGLKECPQMPHREILTMMEILDQIRRKMGVTYPFEA